MTDTGTVRRLDVRNQGLTGIPAAVFDHADTLEILDVSGNRLERLPDDLTRLRRLRILFASDNRFTVLPEVLGAMPSLRMIGMRNNGMASVPAASLPSRLRWLILTGNDLSALPDSIGSCTDLEKVALAGNQLTALPETMASCRRLALLRIAANRIDRLPSWLPAMPALAWLAYGGNPLTAAAEAVPASCATVPWEALRCGPVLGQGASGVISAADLDGCGPRAVKVFKGAITSDGRPASEVAAWLQAGRHPSLIPVEEVVTGHPDGGRALTMPLLDAGWRRLADPPDFDTCSRDTFPGGPSFSEPVVRAILGGIAAAAAHLHHRGILHGDLYGHNILHRDDGRPVLGDFGAASLLAPVAGLRPLLERQEVLAFAHLIDDLLRHCPEAPADLRDLHARCADPDVAARPAMAEVATALAIA